MKKVNALKARFLEIEDVFEYGNNQEQLVYDLEEEVQNALLEAFEDTMEEKQLQKLSNKLKKFKSDNDFYDAEASLDMMFPDRHDEDFDEDSMSWDSVFGN